FMYLLHRLTTFLFFSIDTATTEIYTLSLHDALPILPRGNDGTREKVPRYRASRAKGHFLGMFHHPGSRFRKTEKANPADPQGTPDRKSTRLNSSHVKISYAVFCLKKKKKKTTTRQNK